MSKKITELPVATSLDPGDLVTAVDLSQPATTQNVKITKSALLQDQATQAALDAHKTSADHDGRYYTEAEIDAALAAKTHASLPDTATDGHPGSVITIPGGVTGNAVVIAADDTLQDGGQPPGGGGGGIPEAPTDGNAYRRIDAGWVADPIQDDAPNDSVPKLRVTVTGASSWLSSGGAAILDVGTGAGDVAAGNAPGDAVATHAAGTDVHSIAGVTGLQGALDGKEPTISPKNSAFNVDFGVGGSAGTVSRSDHTHTTLPTANQKDALDGAAAPDSGNVFATMADVGGGGPPVRHAPVSSPTTWDTELDEGSHVYQAADGANLSTWTASLPAGGDAATNEHSCSIDFLPPPSGTWTMTIPGAWDIMSGFQPLTLASADKAATVILRALPDGTIQIYGSEAA